MDTMISSVDSMMSTLSVAISVLAGISLLVGGIGVMNIMLVSVTERTREIGTRKALGATNNNIRLQFVVESVIICLIGGAIGIVLGAIMGYVGSGLLKNAVLPQHWRDRAGRLPSRWLSACFLDTIPQTKRRRWTRSKHCGMSEGR